MTDIERRRMIKHIASLMREAERCYARGDFQGGYTLEGFAQRAEEEMHWLVKQTTEGI